MLDRNIFDSEMTADQIKTLHRIKMAFRTAYQTYLSKKGLNDHSLAMVGFYTVAQKIISHEPLDDVRVQQELCEWVDQKLTRVVRKEMQPVDLLIGDQLSQTLHG